MDRRYLIYVLCDPLTGEPRYVGQTTYDLAKRLREHQWPCALRKHDHRTHWILDLHARGLRPTIEELEEVAHADQLDESEEFWIEQLRALGFRLVNTTKGGAGVRGWHMPEEAKRKISAALKGRKKPPRTEEYCRRQSEAHKGKKPTEKNKAALRAANRRPVIDDRGVVYGSIREAARALGVGSTSIGNLLRGVGGIKRVKGRVFRYTDESLQVPGFDIINRDIDARFGPMSAANRQKISDGMRRMK